MSERPDGDVRGDELRSMLAARADRMPPAAAREVMAAVREETRAGRGGPGFAVVPVVLRGRGATGPAGLAVIGLVAVLVLAVMGGRLDTRPSATAGAGVSDAPSMRGVDQPSVDAEQLRRAIGDGSLNGRIVLLTGRLEVTPIACLGPSECQQIEVVGLDGLGVRYWSANASAAAVRTTIAAHPGPALLAFRVDRTDLVLLGWPLQDTQSAMAPVQLEAPAPELGGDDLAIVSGWLIGAPAIPVSCPAPSSASACDGGFPSLTASSPLPSGQPLYGAAVQVTVDDSLGLGPAPAVVPGPFLVRRMTDRGGNLPPYEVVASLAPTNVVAADVGPTPTASPAASVGPVASAEQNLARELGVQRLLLALQDGSLDGRLVLVTGRLASVAWPCPADAPEPCTRFSIPGLEGVAVTWDGPMAVVNDATASPAPAPVVDGELVVVPHNGHLALLGRLPGDLARPVSVTQFLDQRRLLDSSDPFVLMPVAGWLVIGGIHSCPIQGPGATPCPGPGPLLTDSEPFANGLMTSDVQAPVAIADPVPGISSGQIVTPGPFLLRVSWLGTACADASGSPDPGCRGGLFPTSTVVARYDVSTAYRVALP